MSYLNEPPGAVPQRGPTSGQTAIDAGDESYWDNFELANRFKLTPASAA